MVLIFSQHQRFILIKNSLSQIRRKLGIREFNRVMHQKMNKVASISQRIRFTSLSTIDHQLMS